MNRQQLIALLRAKGYKGAADLKAIQAWLTESGFDPDSVDIEGESEPIKIAKAWETTSRIASKAIAKDDPDPDADDPAEDPEEPEPKAKPEAKPIKKALGTTPAPRVLANAGGPRVSPDVAAYKMRIKNGTALFDDVEMAEHFGAFWYAALCSDAKVLERGGGEHLQKSLDILGIRQKTGSSYNIALGASLIPQELESMVHVLKENYGVVARLFDNTTMQGPTLTFNVEGANPTMYFVGEAAAITAADLEFVPKVLTAKKIGGLNHQPYELVRSSPIAIVDQVTASFARQAAYLEDQCGLIGDGTSTYGGFVGATQALKGVDSTIANIDGLVVGTGNAYSELTLNDFTDVCGILPTAFDTPNTAWVMNKKFYFEVVRKLLDAAGGSTIETLRTRDGRLGAVGPGGYPVVFSQVMPSTEANSQVCALLGDFSLGAKIGRVQQSTRVNTSTEYLFSNDVVTLRYISEFGVSVFGVGDTSAAGPIVGLITAAS